MIFLIVRVILALIILSVISICLCLKQMIVAAIFYYKETQQEIQYQQTPSISVVIPVYNEPEENITQTINSLLQQNVTLEIIIVDDGSMIPVKIPEQPNVKLIHLNKNSGKRTAQIIGIQQSQYEWIATVDSDTVLEPCALSNLYRSTQEQQVNAITGTVFVENRNQNILTKVISCMYGLSIFQQRSEQAAYGCVTCCSGALSLYRKSTILQHQNEYLNQKFLWRKCFAGDDRHLTSLFLLSGNKVGWTSKARCWTKSPYTIYGIIKQQLRWVRSNVSELNYLFKNINKWTIPVWFFTLKLIFMHFFRIFLFVSMIYLTVIMCSVYPVLLTISCLLLVSLLKFSLEYIGRCKLSHETNGIIFLIYYVLFEFLVLTPVVAFGCLTPFVNSWLSRKTQLPK